LIFVFPFQEMKISSTSAMTMKLIWIPALKRRRYRKFTSGSRKGMAKAFS